MEARMNIVLILIAIVVVLAALVLVGVIVWWLGKKFIWNKDGSKQEDNYR